MTPARTARTVPTARAARAALAAHAALATAFTILVALAAGCGPKGPPDTGDFHPGWRSWKKMNAAPFASEGHTAEKYLVDVWVNEVGAAAFAAKTGPYPVGTVILKEHFKDEGGKPGYRALLTTMEKKAPGFDPDNGDWSYEKASADGKVELSGKVEVCSTCHVTAPSDFVFGVP